MDDIKNLIVKVSHTNDVMCDSTSYCADGTHCCYYSSGAPAGCCTDGYTCDVDAGTCDLGKKNSNTASVPMMKKMTTKVEDVMCDSTSYCADGTHCCFYSSGAPAFCCTDGYTCDVDAGTCDGKKNSNTASVPMVKKMTTKVEDVMCDSTSYCADGTHCCFYSSGAPAGCCTDGYTCDVDAGTCDLFGTKTPMQIA